MQVQFPQLSGVVMVNVGVVNPRRGRSPGGGLAAGPTGCSGSGNTTAGPANSHPDPAGDTSKPNTCLAGEAGRSVSRNLDGEDRFCT